ncbi:hypothetical protein Mapa_006325 [Marchantia paleacea]|nr:hypothetical protein Mapa_006325 [Marchantia paleacea]
MFVSDVLKGELIVFSSAAAIITGKLGTHSDPSEEPGQPRKVGDVDTLMLIEVGGLPLGIRSYSSSIRVRTCDSSFHQSNYHLPQAVFYLLGCSLRG